MPACTGPPRNSPTAYRRPAGTFQRRRIVDALAEPWSEYLSGQPPDLELNIANVLPEVDPACVLLIMRAARLGRLTELYRARMAQLGGRLDVTSQAVLGALLMLGPPYRLTPTFLSRHVLQTSGGMTKTLRRLQEEGLVERVPDDHDRRVSHVQLTERGQQVTAVTLSAVFHEWEDALAKRGVDVTEAMSTVTALLEVLENLTGARLGRTLGL